MSYCQNCASRDAEVKAKDARIKELESLVAQFHLVMDQQEVSTATDLNAGLKEKDADIQVMARRLDEMGKREIELMGEVAAAKEEIEKMEKVIEENGHAFQKAQNETLAELSALKAKNEALVEAANEVLLSIGHGHNPTTAELQSLDDSLAPFTATHSKGDVVLCPLNCGGCGCHIDPPCSHCEEGKEGKVSPAPEDRKVFDPMGDFATAYAEAMRKREENA